MYIYTIRNRRGVVACWKFTDEWFPLIRSIIDYRRVPQAKYVSSGQDGTHLPKAKAFVYTYLYNRFVGRAVAVGKKEEKKMVAAWFVLYEPL